MKIGRGLEIYKTVDDTKALATFLDARQANPQTWAIWHSRIATQGQLVDDNCHPFAIPGRPWAMAHNGMLDLSDPPVRARRGAVERSDSRILAEDHLSLATWADLRADLADWEHWLGGSKVVLLSSRKERGGPVLIMNEDQGEWIDGCWHSHGPYAPARPVASWSADLATWQSDDKYDADYWSARDQADRWWAKYDDDDNDDLSGYDLPAMPR
jgi:glutamine amidotransferase